MPTLTLLGPQGARPTIGTVIRQTEGPVAVITAGWQGDENDPLPRGLVRRGVNLEVHRRAERVFQQDPELFHAHLERQARIEQLQRLYRLRLDHAMAALKEVAELPAEGALVDDSRRDALRAVQALDRHHLKQIRAIHADFEARWQPASREVVDQGRDEIEAQLAAIETVVVAGGHVGVLLNRLRLFDLAPLLRGRNVIAWSAGAMALAERIVLFHDSPPWGAGNAELLDVGLGLCRGILPLPDAKRRLRLDDPQRVELLARRFAPLRCIGLDDRAELDRDGAAWRARGVSILQPDGSVRSIRRSSQEVLEG